jgi:hypothetical protein
MSQKVIIFDIETGPESVEELAKVQPQFQAPSNYKDPEKIAEAIEAKRKSWMESAALDATTGQVLAIGTMTKEVTDIKMARDHGEAAIIASFWKQVFNWPTTKEEADKLKYDDLTPATLLGFNCKSFDLPFLIRRSWKLGIQVPIELGGGNLYTFMRDNVRDIMDDWRCTNRDQTISLDCLARFLGVGSKNGNGKDFAMMDTETALQYVANDLALTRDVAMKMGILYWEGKK